MHSWFYAMWNITSSDVQHAKEEAQHRRAEAERRYAEETQALDAELAVIETIERAASSFASRHGRGEAVSAPPADAEPPDPVEPPEPAVTVAVSDDGAAPELPAEPDPHGGEAAVGGGLDILKPGSRWRLYRGSRQSEADDPAGATFPHAG